MVRSRIFEDSKSQVVQLPESVAFPDAVKQVDIVVHGHTRIITPTCGSWDSWFHGEGVSEDFMESRDQSEYQVRELS